MADRLDELGVAGYLDPEARERLADLDVDEVWAIGIAGPLTPGLLLRIHELGPWAVAELAHELVAGPFDPDDLAVVLKVHPDRARQIVYASGAAGPFDDSRQVADLIRPHV